MYTVDELIDRAKLARGIDSDYRFAKELGVTVHTVANWRHDRSRPDDDAALTMAEWASLDPCVVLASIHAGRIKSERARDVWAQVAARLEKASGVAAAVILSVLFSGGPDAGAQAKSGDFEVAVTNISKLTRYTLTQIKRATLSLVYAIRLGRLRQTDFEIPAVFVPSQNFA